MLWTLGLRWNDCSLTKTATWWLRLDPPLEGRTTDKDPWKSPHRRTRGCWSVWAGPVSFCGRSARCLCREREPGGKRWRLISTVIVQIL